MDKDFNKEHATFFIESFIKLIKLNCDNGMYEMHTLAFLLTITMSYSKGFGITKSQLLEMINVKYDSINGKTLEWFQNVND